jgi:hypothetical protein
LSLEQYKVGFNCNVGSSNMGACFSILHVSELLAPVEPGAGRGRGLVAKSQLVPGDLLVFSPALGCLEGEWQSAPTPEDLHAAMMEAGLRPAQRRVIDMLYDGSEASTSKATSLATLDAKFWSSRGKSDSQAPQVWALPVSHCRVQRQ